MIGIESTAEEARKFLQNVRQVLAPAVLEELAKAVNNIQEKMSTEGKPVSYPIQWDSEKQRKAYFASDGFTLKKGERPAGYRNKNIPYKRTGNYQNGWKVESITNGYKLSNKHPAAAIGGFLDGWQSRIHRGRWQALTIAVYSEIAKLPRNIIERLEIMAKGSAKL